MEGLPNVLGPKLHPFDGGRPPAELDFIELLGSGEHAHVWKVRINGKIYAMKIVFLLLGRKSASLVGGNADISQFRMDDRFKHSTWWDVELNDEDQRRYMHPFNCEARAYARLKELSEEKIAVRCYGYIILGEKYQKALRKKDLLDWEEDWGYCEEFKGRPLQALVKDFVEVEVVDWKDRAPDTGWRLIARAIEVPGTAKKLIKNLKILHRAGILCKDIHSNNVVNGIFLEFSSAWTVPHPCLSTAHIEAQKSPAGQTGRADALEVDRLIDEWNRCNPFKQVIWRRAGPNRKYQSRLRSHQHPPEWRRPWNWNRGYRLRPDKFRWEKIPEMMKRKVEQEAKRRREEKNKKKERGKERDRKRKEEGSRQEKEKAMKQEEPERQNEVHEFEKASTEQASWPGRNRGSRKGQS